MYFLYFIEQDKYIYYIRALARNGKNSVFGINWGKDETGGLRGTASPSVGSVGDKGQKPLENLQYLS